MPHINTSFGQHLASEKKTIRLIWRPKDPQESGDCRALPRIFRHEPQSHHCPGCPCPMSQSLGNMDAGWIEIPMDAAPIGRWMFCIKLHQTANGLCLRIAYTPSISRDYHHFPQQNLHNCGYHPGVPWPSGERTRQLPIAPVAPAACGRGSFFAARCAAWCLRKQTRESSITNGPVLYSAYIKMYLYIYTYTHTI